MDSFLFMAKVKDERFLNFTREVSGATPIRVTMDIDSAGVGRCFCIYEKRQAENEEDLEDRVKVDILEEYNRLLSFNT